MGVDVSLYVVGDVSDAELDQSNAYLAARGVRGDWDEADTAADEGPALIRDKYEPGRVEWATCCRYYGPGYERGHWPEIHNAIACVRAALPGYAVYYGPDSCDEGDRVTDALLADLWAHWLSAAGQSYRVMSRAINEAWGNPRA